MKRGGAVAKTKEKFIVVEVRGGAVQNVDAPKGTRVIVRDYDVEGTESEEELRRDKDGDPYAEFEWLC